MSNQSPGNNLSFLAGNSEMVTLTREKDWSNNPLGVPAQWPQSLCTALGIILHSKFPMVLWWGPQLISFYNDAYLPSLGQSRKHPSILGMGAAEAWAERWDAIQPLINTVLTGGEATWSEDELIPVYKNDVTKDVYWTYSFSQVNDESGKIGGVLVTCTETTEKVITIKELNESKSQLEFAIEATELATWDYDPISHAFKADSRYIEWFGEPAPGQTHNELALKVIAEEDRERVIKAYMEVAKYGAGNKFDMEYRIRPLHKPERILKAKGKAWFNKDKICYRFTGTLQDITISALARKKIEESEKEFRELADSLPQLVWTTDNEGRQTFVSKRWIEFTGINPSDEESFAKMTHPDDLKNVMQTWSQALASNNNYKTEIRLKSKSGEYNWFYVDGEPIKNEKGEVEKWVGTFTNIHEQRKAEEISLLTSQRFQFLADTMPQFVWTADSKGNINYFNKAVYEYCGLSKEQVKLDKWLQIINPDDREENMKLWMRAVNTGDDFVFSHRFRRYDGEYRWQLSRAKPQRDTDGVIQMWIGTSTDIQDIKELDQQKDSFMAMASHELKTPVTTIKVYGQIAESLLTKMDDTMPLTIVKKMSTQVNRLSTLIDDLLNITRIQTGKLIYDKELFDFNDLVKEVVEDMQKTTTQHTIETHFDTSAIIDGDKNKVVQVVNNLISNAIKYSPLANKIIITSSLAGDNIQLSIRDFGIGVPQDEQNDVFKQFYRVKGDYHDTFPGLGIGLYICAEIIKQHKGNVWVESIEGKGSTFYFSIPVHVNSTQATEGITLHG